MRRRPAAQWAISNSLCVAVLAAGCSQSGIGVTGIGAVAAPSPLTYQHATAFSPAGYSESLIGEDRYRIEVKGPLGTPRERLEKIANTRAAEIGRDAKHKYFKVEGVQVATSCKSYVTGGKPGSMGSGQQKTIAHTILTADVTYAKAPADPAFLETRGAFERYRAELDQDQTVSSAPDPATSQCQ
jgi:hypothetical protein